jgi:hypothetical protein
LDRHLERGEHPRLSAAGRQAPLRLDAESLALQILQCAIQGTGRGDTALDRVVAIGEEPKYLRALN